MKGYIGSSESQSQKMVFRLSCEAGLGERTAETPFDGVYPERNKWLRTDSGRGVKNSPISANSVPLW